MRTANLRSKTLTALRRDPRVEDIENEGCDDERFFVHLKTEWSYTQDPRAVTHSQSFSRAADAVKAVRSAVPASEWAQP
jgi:hypothetical protein